MCAAPVCDNHTFVAPVVFENLVEEHFVVAGVLAADFVVGAHDGPAVTVDDGAFERRKIDFVECTV